MVGKLRKVWKKWAWLLRILVQEGDNLQVLEMFFKEVVQAVYIFGLETWVMNPCMGRALGFFITGCPG